MADSDASQIDPPDWKGVTDYTGKYVAHYDSYTWTYALLKTDFGEVKIRWLGESNGYYAEVPMFDRAPLSRRDADWVLPEDMQDCPDYAKHDWFTERGYDKYAEFYKG